MPFWVQFRDNFRKDLAIVMQNSKPDSGEPCLTPLNVGILFCEVTPNKWGRIAVLVNSLDSAQFARGCAGNFPKCRDDFSAKDSVKRF